MTPGNFGPEKVFDKNLPRCNWCNLKNPEYVAYHDNEWGKFSDLFTLDADFSLIFFCFCTDKRADIEKVNFRTV